jgi:Cu(I)/Ag(I) efflux system protein CusF
MKRITIAALTFIIAPLALAQSGGMKGMDMKGMDMKMETKGAKGKVHKAAGVVTNVDAAKSKVTIKHEPVQSLNWPSMTMAFSVKDKAVLDKLAKDKKVDFEFKEEGKDYVITDVK